MTSPILQIIDSDKVPANRIKMRVDEVRDDEIAVASIPGLRAWPAAHNWGINADGVSLVDRMLKADAPSRGAAYNAQFSARGTEAATFKALVNSTTSGIKVPAFGSSGSFTFAFCASADSLASDAIKVGSASVPGGGTYLFISTETATGKARFGTAVSSSTFAAYSGPNLAVGAGNWTRYLMEYDRSASEIRLHVNGALAATHAHASFAAAVLSADMYFGTFNNNVSPYYSAPCRYLEPLVFDGLLSGADRALVDAMFVSAIDALTP